jgi:hypothetical protein
MQFLINDKLVDVPTDLSLITLGQFLRYWDQHGRELDKRLTDISSGDYEDEFDQTIDLLELEYEEAIAWYSFFTGYDFSIIRNQESNELLTHYRIIRDLLRLSETESYTLNQDIEWKDKVWSIRDWKVTPNSSFTFNELLTSKEAARQIHSLGKGKWEALPYLCAVFLRKKGEHFSDSLVMEGSERLAMMQELPMSIAVQVAFFLSVGVNIFQTTFQYSKQAATAMQT